MADNITIIAELRDLISRPAGQAIRALSDMERQIKDLDREFKAGNISQAEYIKQLRKMGRTSRLAGRESKGFRKEIDKHVNSLGRTKRRGLRGILVDTTKGLFGFAAGVAKGSLALIKAAPRVLKLATGFSILIPVIFAATGALVAMAGSAAPMIGLLGAIPGLGLAAGAGLGVLLVGVTSLAEGIGMLASGTATVEEMNEFWAKFTPEAKEFGIAVAGIAPGLTLIRDAIHRSLLPNLGQALVRIGEHYVPFFEQKMGDIASAIGRVADHAATTFTSPAFMGDMAKVWDSTTRLVETLGRAGVSVLSGLRGLMVAAIPMTEKVGGAIESAFGRFDRWANSPVGRNKMGDFFDDAWSTAVTFFGTLKDIAIGIWNIMQIGKDLGDTLGLSMSESAQAFRDWTASAEGKNEIRQFFLDIRDTLDALGRLGGAVMDELFATGTGKGEQNSAVNMIDGITAAVPGIFTVIRALITFAGWIGKAIVWTVKFFEWIGKIPGIGGLLQVIAAVALFGTKGKIVWTILTWIARALLFAFGGWVLALIVAIIAGIVWLWRESETFRKIVGGITEGIRTGWGQIREGFIDPIIEGVRALIRAIGDIDWPSPPDWMTASPGEIGGGILDRIKDAPNRWRDRFREKGGPVFAGNTYTVGEGGREFLLTPSGVTMLGEQGRESVRMTEPGLVIPNGMTEALLSQSVPSMAGVGGRGGSSSEEAAPAMPTVSVGPFYGAHPDEVRQAVAQGIRDAQRASETKQGRRL